MKRLLISFVILTAAAGCAVNHPSDKSATPSSNDVFVGPPMQTPPAVEPPKPKYNLSGFPLPYRQGYDDGCNSVKGGEKKDAQRFARDTDYRIGWQDGYSMCAPKK